MTEAVATKAARPAGSRTVRGKFELLLPAPVNANLNNYERSTIFTCTAGQVIARVITEEAVDGAEGAVAQAEGAEAALLPEMRQVASMVTLGKHVTLNADMTVTAVIDGRVVQRGNALSVEPVLEVPGNVDFATGNIDFHGDVIVHGNVLDLFRLRSGAEVMVQGVIEGATLEVAGDLTVRGGIAGKSIGHVRAGGKVAARYLSCLNRSVRG